MSFRAYSESRAEHWVGIVAASEEHERRFADRMLAALHRLAGEAIGHPVDRFEHSLQTATRAFREGADEETVVCALLHDIGDDLAPYNHGPLAAEALKPYVSAENCWLVRHHEIFQGYYFFHHIGRDRHEREAYRGHPGFERTATFCERWDQRSFDPGYDTMPLAAFEPMVRRLFARAPRVGLPLLAAAE